MNKQSARGRWILMLALGFMLALAQAGAAEAAEIKVVCGTALRTIMQELIPQFEKATGHKVTIEYGVSAQIQRRVEAGEQFDAIFLTAAPLDALIKSGKIVAGTRTNVARSGMAIAARAGAPKADLSTVEGLKRTVLGAKSIAYATEGASGIYFAALAKKLGIFEQLKIKGQATGDAVGAAVAKGEAELGILPVSEILPVKGVEVLGEFPKEVQDYAVMVAGVAAGAGQAAAAKELIAFTTAPAALPVVKQKGMEPVR